VDDDLDPELIRFLREELGHEVARAREWTVTGPLWLWKGKNAASKPSPMSWVFLTISGDAAAGIRAAAPGRSAAWGSVYVSVTLGGTNWTTSVFPSKEAGGYLLPVKAAVRKKEKVAEGNVVTVTLRV
jgi:hypothetical protein